MIYSACHNLPFNPTQTWEILRNLQHYVDRDPFHSNLRFLNYQREGQGVQFRMHHSYFPNFPFFPDEVLATVTVWQPEQQQTILEENPKTYRNHTQTFLLEPTTNGTKLTYQVQYMGIPMWLLPWRLWVHWNVTRRLHEKLRQLEETISAQVAAETTPRHVPPSHLA